MFRMWDIQELPCLGCWLYGMQDVQNAEYLAHGMFGMWSGQM